MTGARGRGITIGMDTTTNPATEVAMTIALHSVRPGSVITIACAGHKPRTVTVTSVTDRYVYTTSGRPVSTRIGGGGIRGGCIRIESDGATYQPTMAQNVRRVESVEIVGFAAPKMSN